MSTQITSQTATTTTGLDTATNATTRTVPTTGELIFNYAMFGFSTIVSAAILYYLLADPTRLSAAWEWIRGLPLVIQVVMWLLLLPWMIALWVWSMPWALAIRLVLVVCVVLFAEYLVFPWKP